MQNLRDVRRSGSGLLLLWGLLCSPIMAEQPALGAKSPVTNLNIHFHQASDTFNPDTINRWITRSADIVSEYYGRFPVQTSVMDITLFPGGGITGGRAFGEPEPRITLTVGEYNTDTDLGKDWRLIHEMVHLAFPRVPRAHRWIEEGLATYLESVIRARHGQLSAEFVWRGFVRGMPHGLPDEGETGLDGNQRWGNVYWGGALFALVADVRIREQTDNKFSIRDAMRAILDAGMDHRDESELAPLLKLADKATGTQVMQSLYREAATQRWEISLEQLWHKLGVPTSEAAVFDDNASLAWVRKAITDTGM